MERLCLTAPVSRRSFLAATVTGSSLGLARSVGIADELQAEKSPLRLYDWVRDSRNPIFVPRSSFDEKGSQGPCVVLYDGLWWMFYAGIGTDGVQRICLATANPDKPTEWERLGPILDLGLKGTFDERSATYPRVHRFGKRWHLYYSGRSARSTAQHFSNYWGIGLAQSDDLRTWTKYSAEPVLQGDGVKEYPDSRALVGLGNIIELPHADGRTIYRMYYTVLPGMKDPEWQTNGTWHVIEHKVCAAAHSFDGIEWSDRRLVLERRRDVPTEDIGVVGLNVWKTGSRFRGVYTALGTKYKTYALAEVTSPDGLNWDRGAPRDNISLIPAAGCWDSGMIGYPCVLPEGEWLRIFYNGVGGGATGIGMARVRMLD